MLNTLLAAMALGAAAPAQSIDTIVPVDRDARLSVHNQRGDIVIDAWDRSAVRILTDRDDEDGTTIERTGSILRVRSRPVRGAARRTAYRITVPAWMPIDASGPFTDIAIGGVAADVAVETVQGDITIRGGRRVATHSVDGEVVVSDADGGADVETVNGDVRLTRVSGAVRVHAVNGDVELSAVRSSRLAASTVNGDVLYRGVIRDGGRYRLATHNGDVRITVPGSANVTVTASTYHGELETSFPIRLTELRSDRRFRFVLGSGAAELEIEAFQGTIELRRSGTDEHGGDGEDADG